MIVFSQNTTGLVLAHLHDHTMANYSSTGPSLPLSRQTSASTGLSYLASTSPPANPRRRYIFIHGWACTSLDFLPLISALSASDPKLEDSYIAPDAPGLGYSPQSLMSDPTVLAIANLINKLRVELSTAADENHGDIDTILVGHSMGCRIALETFAQSPANIKGLVLLDGSWYGPNPKDYKPWSTNKDEELQIVLATFSTMLGPATPENFKQQVFDHLRKIDLDYANKLRINYITWDGERMDDVMKNLRARNDDSRNPKTMVMVVQGTEGHGAGRHSLKKGEEGPWMKFVRDRIGDQYSGLIVENSGHWPHVDRVEEVASAIKVFAEEL